MHALADVEHRLLKEIKRLDTIDKSSGAIRNHADKISDEVRKGRKELSRVTENAKATLRALNIELREDDVEVANPIIAEAYEPSVGSDAGPAETSYDGAAPVDSDAAE